jgi:hypothetical protein
MKIIFGFIFKRRKIMQKRKEKFCFDCSEKKVIIEENCRDCERVREKIVDLEFGDHVSMLFSFLIFFSGFVSES